MRPERARATSGERLARLVYRLLWLVAAPAVAVYLLWRSRRQPAYREGWSQRFLGRYRERPTGPCIWIHAVSVGETRAAAPLIDALRTRRPDLPVLVTHMTPTGLETAASLFGDRVHHAYLAYDYPHATTAFFRHWGPAIGVVMETEIWPELMAAATEARVPMILANGRLSAKSLASARRWSALMRPAARRFERILAQTDADAKRFAMLAGSDAAITTVGNVKFDIEPPATQRELAVRFRRWIEPAESGRTRGVFLFASTREGEERAIVDAWLRRPEAAGPAVLAIVPRHPQRFDEVVDLIRSRDLIVQRRSDPAPLRADADVWVGDSMGELWAYYLAADVAYIGGSIAPLGGQNLIEAAAAGCPILIGPHTFNFAAASDDAVRAGAALRVADFDALIATGLALIADAGRRRAMADAGLAFAAAHRGATARTVAIIEETLAAWGAEPPISRS